MNDKPPYTVTWDELDTIVSALHTAHAVYDLTHGPGDGMTKSFADLLEKLDAALNEKAR